MAYFYPLNFFYLFGFPSWKSSILKIIGIKIYLFENFSQKKGSPKILGDPFRVKIVKNSRPQIVFRTDIFWKLTLGAPACLPWFCSAPWVASSTLIPMRPWRNYKIYRDGTDEWSFPIYSWREKKWHEFVI